MTETPPSDCASARTFSRFARRLLVGFFVAAASSQLGCSDDAEPGASGVSGSIFQFTIEGPSISRRTATFRPTSKEVSFPGGQAWFHVGPGTDTPSPVSEEGETYGQIFFHLSDADSQVGDHPIVDDSLQIAVFPTPDTNDKVLRADDDDGVPGSLSVSVTKRTAKSIEGTFSGTLNCTNCRPTEAYSLTAGTFRLVD